MPAQYEIAIVIKAAIKEAQQAIRKLSSSVERSFTDTVKSTQESGKQITESTDAISESLEDMAKSTVESVKISREALEQLPKQWQWLAEYAEEANLPGLANQIEALAPAATKAGQGLQSVAPSAEKAAKELGDLGPTTEKAAKAFQGLGPGATRAAREVQGSTRTIRERIRDLMDSFDALEGVAKLALAALGSYYVRMAAEAIYNLGKVAAVNLAMEESFATLGRQHGVSSEAIIQALKKASAGTVAETDLMLAANKALRLGVATTIRDFESLMKIAVVRSKDFGMTTTEAFNKLIDALASGYPYMLKQLGFAIDAQQANEEYAESIGTTARELDEYQQIQALVNQVLEQGADDIERWSEASDSAATSFERLDTKVADLKQGIGELVVGPLSDLIDELNKLPTIINQITYLRELNIEYMKAGWGEFFALVGEGDWAAILMDQHIRAAEGAQVLYATLDAATPVVERLTDGVLEDVRAMQAAERATIDWGAATQFTTEQLSEAYDGLRSRFGYLYDLYQEAADQAERSADDQVRAWQRVENQLWSLQRRYERGLERLARDLGRDRARLERRLADDLVDIQRDAERDMIDARIDYQRDYRDLLHQHARDREEFERRVTFDVFEAAGRRDAISIRRIQRQARYERGRMRREQRDELGQLRTHLDDRLEDIQTAREREEEDARIRHDRAMRELEIRGEERRDELRYQLEAQTQDAIDQWHYRNRQEQAIAQDHLYGEMLPLYGTYYETLLGYDAAWRNQVQQPVNWPQPPPITDGGGNGGGGGDGGDGGPTCPPGYVWNGTRCIYIPEFQAGGIVPGYPGQPVPIMAHAGEVVIPRTGLISSQMGTQMTIRHEVNISGSLDVRGDPTVAEQVSEQVTAGFLVAMQRVTGQRV